MNILEEQLDLIATELSSLVISEAITYDQAVELMKECEKETAANLLNKWKRAKNTPHVELSKLLEDEENKVKNKDLFNSLFNSNVKEAPTVEELVQNHDVVESVKTIKDCGNIVYVLDTEDGKQYTDTCLNCLEETIGLVEELKARENL